MKCYVDTQAYLISSSTLYSSASKFFFAFSSLTNRNLICSGTEAGAGAETGGTVLGARARVVADG